MKKQGCIFSLLLGLSVILLLLGGCTGTNSKEESLKTSQSNQLNQRLDRLSIEVSPGETYPGYYVVKPDSLIQIIAKDFPPKVYLHTELGIPNGKLRRSLATSQLDEEGKGQQAIFFPSKWSNGSDLEEGEMFLVLTWDKSGNQLIVPLQFRKD